METNLLPYGASTYSKSRVAYGDDLPLYVTHGRGWRIFDTGGKDYVDMVMGLGSVILGHCHPHVDDAIRHQLSLGTTFSLGCPIELEAAERLLAHFPPGSMVQWGTNGSDATTGALRLARTTTGRRVVIMFDDGYHGFHDWCLADTIRGEGIPSNDYFALARVRNWHDFQRYTDINPSRIAAVIVEPDLHPERLHSVRNWCTKAGALMICDEVMTWQRYPKWTASNYFGIEPDIYCLGKSLGNGMPVSAIVGPKEILKGFAPGAAKNAFFSSTWAGHPLSMAAVIATLDVMEKENGPQKIWDKAEEVNRLIKRTYYDKRPSVDPTYGLATLPFNRLAWSSTRAARAWRSLMIEAGCHIYLAHNLSLAHDDNAFACLLTAWQYAAKHLPERLIGLKDEDSGSGIMRR